MSDQKPIQVSVTRAQTLTQEEKTLLDEVTALQSSSISNLRDAFRQMITLSSTISTIQATLLGLLKYSFSKPLGVVGLLIVLSFLAFFISAALAVIGQLGSKTDLSTLDMLAQYRSYRRKKIRIGYRYYMAVSLFFLIGLALFLVSAVLLLLL
jgi:hypothetical protein